MAHCVLSRLPERTDRRLQWTAAPPCDSLTCPFSRFALFSPNLFQVDAPLIQQKTPKKTINTGVGYDPITCGCKARRHIHLGRVSQPGCSCRGRPGAEIALGDGPGLSELQEGNGVPRPGHLFRGKRRVRRGATCRSPRHSEPGGKQVLSEQHLWRGLSERPSAHRLPVLLCL